MTREPDKARELFDDAVELVRRKQPRIALLRLLDVLRHDPQHREALASAARLATMLGDLDLSRHFEKLSRSLHDAEAYYDLGYYLTGAGRPDLAAVFLGQCLELEPYQDLVRHELGYALFRARRFPAALSWLRDAWRSTSLSPAESTESGLLLVECLLYAREPLEAGQVLDTLTQEAALSDEQRRRCDALGRLLGRARFLPSDREADLRDWHFVQHGGVLLRLVGAHETKGAAGGRCLEASPGYAFTAAVLKLGAHLLVDLERVPERVLAASDSSVPLAAVVAHLLGRPAAPFRETDDGLLVVRSLAELGPRQRDLVAHRDGQSLFAFCLDWRTDSPILPDIVGIMARHLSLPWENEYKVGTDENGRLEVQPSDERPDLMAVTQDLIAVADEVDIEREREHLRRFYSERRDDLVLGNPALYPERFAFTAHSPVETSDLIFP
ncbi:MAG: hypothetical protein AB1486_11100 [Planctomycetota bacterium]